MNIMSKKRFCLSLLLVPVLFLSGCLPGSEGNSATSIAGTHSLDDGSEVLMTIDGRPVITMNSFNAEFDRLLQENPQLAQVLPLMTDEKSNFLKGMVNQEIVDYYITDKGMETFFKNLQTRTGKNMVSEIITEISYE